MPGFSIDTAPLDRLADGLGDAGDQLRDTSSLLRAAGEEVARLAAPRPPRATGRLAGSLHLVPESDRMGVRWGVGYAVYVNFGPRRMRARPFATDALKAAESSIEDAAVRFATDALEVV